MTHCPGLRQVGRRTVCSTFPVDEGGTFIITSIDLIQGCKPSILTRVAAGQFGPSDSRINRGERGLCGDFVVSHFTSLALSPVTVDSCRGPKLFVPSHPSSGVPGRWSSCRSSLVDPTWYPGVFLCHPSVPVEDLPTSPLHGAPESFCVARLYPSGTPTTPLHPRWSSSVTHRDPSSLRGRTPVVTPGRRSECRGVGGSGPLCYLPHPQETVSCFPGSPRFGVYDYDPERISVSEDGSRRGR